MNDFENALLNGLPLAEAAAFHVQLLGYDRPKTAGLAETVAKNPGSIAAPVGAVLGAGGLAVGLNAGYNKLKKDFGNSNPKTATAGGMAAPTLPPTATGQQMPAPAPVTLPGTAMGQNTIKQAAFRPTPAHFKAIGLNDSDAKSMAESWPIPHLNEKDTESFYAEWRKRGLSAPAQKKHAASDKTPEEVGKERARASLSAEKEKAEAHKREHGGGLVGSITGAALGGYASHRYGKGNPLATIAGAAVGHHIAGKTGREIGAVMDRHAKTASAETAGKVLGGLGGIIAVNRTLMAAGVRNVASSNPAAIAGTAGALVAGAALGGALGGRIGAYFGADKEKLGAAVKRAFEEVQNAGMGMGPSSPVDPQQAAQALDQPPAKPTPVTPAVDQATQQYLATQQELNQATDASAVQFYQEQLAAAKEQLEAAQQEAQQLQQSQAMHEQELAQIQAQVADSTQKAMMASDQVLKEQQGAAAMRMAYQQLRGQILNTVSSDPPSMSPDQAAMSAASTGAAPSSAPDPTAGPAGQAPAPGTPPGSPAPEGDATVPNADGIAMSKPMMDTAQPAVATGQKEQTGDAKTPQKEVLAAAVSKMTKAVGALKKHGPGAAAGAALGAATGHYETKRDVSHVKAVEKDLEGKKDRSFSESRRLGAAKAELATDDYAKKNPGKFTAMSAAAGGVAGGVLGPKMKDNIVKVREHVRSLRAAQAAAKKK